MRKQTAIWKTKTGAKIRICDMSDSHLINAAKLIERTQFHQELELISCIGIFQGEMAQYYAEQELDRYMDEPLEDKVPIYGKLINEIERRGLKLP